MEKGEWRMENVEVFDVFGRKQKGEGRREKGEGSIELDVSHLSAGVYFLRVDGQTVKIVKQ